MLGDRGGRRGIGMKRFGRGRKSRKVVESLRGILGKGEYLLNRKMKSPLCFHAIQILSFSCKSECREREREREIGTYFENSCTCTTRDDSSSSRNIESIMTIPTSSNNITDWTQRLSLLNLQTQSMFPHDPCTSRYNLGFPIQPCQSQCTEECAYLRWICTGWEGEVLECDLTVFE